jgi:hypothetical protein
VFIKLNTLLYKLKGFKGNTLLYKLKGFLIKLDKINRFKAILALNNKFYIYIIIKKIFLFSL